jgi:uncharacterized protein (TIGR03437 family)
VAVNQDGRVNSASAPARRGQVLVIYATGQGAVSPSVEDGVAAPAVPLAVTPSLPEVSVGGRPAVVQFSGLAPGFAGLWQINVVIPADAPAGAAAPLVITQGLASRPLSVALQ